MHALLDDVEWVHESVRSDGCACTGRGGGDGMVARGIAAHGLFYYFIRGEVDGVRGA